MEPIQNERTDAHNSTEESIAEVVANKIQTVNTGRLHAEQKKDSNCRNFAA